MTIKTMVAATLPQCAQLWERLLFSSGRALELLKWYYHIIHWYWGKLGYPRMTLIPQKMRPQQENTKCPRMNSYVTL